LRVRPGLKGAIFQAGLFLSFIVFRNLHSVASGKPGFDRIGINPPASPNLTCRQARLKGLEKSFPINAQSICAFFNGHTNGWPVYFLNHYNPILEPKLYLKGI